MKKIIALVFFVSSLASYSSDYKDLTLEDALAKALKNNLDIQISKISYKKAAEEVKGAYGIYDINFKASTDYLSAKSPSASRITASQYKSTNLNMSVDKMFSTGGTATIYFNNNKSDTPGFSFSTFNPEYKSTLGFRFDQPLLNGYGKKTAEYQIILNKKYSKKAFLQYKETVIKLLSDTESAFLDLVYSFKNLQVAKESLELAKEQYDITKKKVDVGTLAPIELLQSESNVASFEQKLVEAENLVWAAEDNLKRILNIKKQDWTVKFQPVWTKDSVDESYELNNAIETALQKNPVILKARIDSAIASVNLNYSKNKTKPSLNFFASLSYQGNNAVLALDPVTGQPLLDSNGYPIILVGSYSDAFSNMSDFDNDTYSFGLKFSYPLKNRAAKASYQKAKLDVVSNELLLNNTIFDITNQVRDAIRRIESSKRSIEAAEKTLKLRAQNLEIEKKKFINGMSTNFEVSSKEKDLAEAKVSVLQAHINYRKAIITLKLAMGTLLEDKGIELTAGDKN
jgi:outer membrane protein TolC